MRKTINFFLALGISFSKAYLLMIIYNTFVSTSFNLSELNYWSVYFIHCLFSLGTNKNIIKDVINESEKELNGKYVIEKTNAFVGYILFIWAIVLIIKFCF